MKRKKGDSIFMEYLLIFAMVGVIYFSFKSNFWFGLIVTIATICFIPKFDWKNSKTTIGKFIQKNIDNFSFLRKVKSN